MLYFSSNGHQGMGGLDMYVAKGNKVDWKEVSNMKYPFNSPKDDFGIVLDSTGKSGFFSSNREGGKGGDDIYHFRNPTCVVAGLTLQMMDGSEKPLEDVMLTIYKKGDTASVIAYERSASTHAKKVCLRNYQPCATVYNAQGTFFLNLQPGVYEVKASKSGYFTQLATVEADCQGEDTIKLAMQLNPIILNKPIVLKDLFYDENDKLFVKKNIYYDLDKADIRYDAAMELDKLVEMLKNNPDIKIELSSHTDSRHTNEYNLSLAQRRAEAAVKYIVSKGISKDKIVAKGYGEEKLINHCKDGVSCSEEEHQQNRRTEIMVTEIIAPETHVVGPYDTLYTISRKYNISVDDLKDINDLSNEVIYAGDVIKLKK
jgi:outer membrane protein OmpA-like peptidoglycan-associated protein